MAAGVKDIYQREARALGGVFSVDKAVAVFSGGIGSVADQKALVQGVEWSYPRDVKYIYELGSPNEYRVLGRTRGTMTINRIIGAGNLTVDSTLFDACGNGGTLTLKASSSFCVAADAKTVTYTFTGVMVTDIGGNISVEDQMIRERLTLAFTGFTKSQ